MSLGVIVGDAVFPILSEVSGSICLFLTKDKKIIATVAPSQNSSDARASSISRVVLSVANGCLCVKN